MDKDTALKMMLGPSQQRKGTWRQGTIQIWITRACDRACAGCTQGSQLKKNSGMFITPENFERACKSLRNYFGVVGIFGGNPVLHPQFEELCEILAGYIPFVQRGVWCNHPKGKGQLLRRYFNAAYSNLNVHENEDAFEEFKRDWPESNPFGLEDSQHSPVHGSMIDLAIPESERWERIANCDINQKWSALVGQFRGECRAWFCEVAGGQSIIWQDYPDYPDTGIPITDAGEEWWRLTMADFAHQAEYHCHRCLVPLRGEGYLSNSKGPELTTKTYLPVFQPKGNREVVCAGSYDAIQPQEHRKVYKYNEAVYQ